MNDDIFKKLTEILSEYTDTALDEKTIVLNLLPENDDWVFLRADIETAFDIEIDDQDEDVRALDTIGDFVTFIASRTAGEQ